MKKSGRAVGATIAVVAIVLTTLGVVWAATDSNPGGASDSALALHGRVPRTALLSMRLDTGQRNAITGTAAIDFLRERARISINIPTVFNTTTVTAIVTADHVYVTTPNYQSLLPKPWVSVPVNNVNFSNLALAMSAYLPDAFVLAKVGPITMVKQGPFTIYTATRSGSLAGLGLPASITGTGTITVSVRVASEGQIADIVVHARAERFVFSAAVHVDAYNAPVRVNVPPARDVTPAPSHLPRRFIGGHTPITQLLTPQGITSLGPILVN